MKLKLLIVACFVATLSVYVAARSFASRAATQQTMPGKMDIPSVDEKWGKVAFDHQQHLPFSDCIYCHHTTKGLTAESFSAGKTEKVQLCADCHARKEGDAKTPKNKEGEELWSKLAYHVNCIDCHKGEITKIPKDVGMAAIKKQNAGPTKCAECHEKKD